MAVKHLATTATRTNGLPVARVVDSRSALGAEAEEVAELSPVISYSICVHSYALGVHKESIQTGLLGVDVVDVMVAPSDAPA